MDGHEVGAGAHAPRGRRSLLVAGGAALALALVVGGVLVLHGDPAERGRPVANRSERASNPGHRSLLGQLQAMPKVRENLMAPVREGQVVLCGINVQGRDPAAREIFAFILCGAFTTGPDAELFSGGSDPVVITTDGRDGPEFTVVDIEFPGMANREARIREMFPPALVDTMTSPQELPIEPTRDEMLETARTWDR